MNVITNAGVGGAQQTQVGANDHEGVSAGARMLRMLACAGCGKYLSDDKKSQRPLQQAAATLQGWRSIIRYLEKESKESDILKRGEKCVDIASLPMGAIMPCKKLLCQPLEYLAWMQ